MTLFKKHISILFILFWGLTSCVKADKTPKDPGAELRGYSLVENLQQYNERALFLSGAIGLDEKQFSFSGKSAWKQYDQVKLYFKLCGLKDTASQGRMNGAKFQIKSELGYALDNPRSVDSGGCLTWAQAVPDFNYLAPSNNLVLHFEIDSMASGMGRIIRRVGINPWDMFRSKSLSSGFQDLTNFNYNAWPEGNWVFGEENVVAALKGEYKSEGHSIRLEMTSVSFEPTRTNKKDLADYRSSLESLSEEELKKRLEYEESQLSQEGMKFDMLFKGNPQVVVKDATGVQHTEKIDSGKFDIAMVLLAVNASQDNKYYKLGYSANNKWVNVTPPAVTWEANPTQGLQASLPMLLERDSTYGEVKLAIKVTPKDLRGVEPFMAVFNLGQYNQWARRQSPTYEFAKFEPLTEANYDDIVGGASVPEDHLASIRAAEPFRFGPLKMRFVRIMPGESATDRTFQYSVTTCVQDGLFRTRAGRGWQFDIITRDNEVDHPIRRETNEDGCLTWFGFVSHKYYQKEVLQEKTAKVWFTGTRRLKDLAEGEEYREDKDYENFVDKFNKEFVYYMNPWDEKWTFGWDKPDMPYKFQEKIEQQRKTAPDAKLFLADFRYETMGFRYAIDKYLKLKVKKAVLLKAYPYVLKYNSMVRGRSATEPLRDGVYLMKVALQKDYLDPAAKGVRIYNRTSPHDKDPDYDPLTMDDSGDKTPGSSFPVARACGDQEFDKDHPSLAEMSACKEINYKQLTSEEMLEDKKEYISIQQKLIRVMGGIIVTPIEFEVEDLRLMRIRNQFFIQLQTIDEHKLRLATVLDGALNEMYKDNNLEQKYKDIFAALKDIKILFDKQTVLTEELLSHTNDLDAAAHRLTVQRELDEIGLSLQAAKDKVTEMLGLNAYKKRLTEDDGVFSEKDEKAFARFKAIVDEKFQRLEQFREVDLDELASFRQTKRDMINRVVLDVGSQSKELMERNWSENSDEEYRSNFEDDPIQQFFYLGGMGSSERTIQRILDYRINKARVAGDEQRVEDLSIIRSADFTESPLTPSFSFEMLANDGTTDDKSGLPARTFVGPLTFVMNTNGSSLRPTDILNENFCPDAFCDVPKMKADGLIPINFEATEKSFKLNPDGGMAAETSQPIFDSGDSVNKTYENNKYYGYIGAYYGWNFTKLIERKRKIDEKNFRKMEMGSQIINFVKEMELKYALLDESDERSHLIDFQKNNCDEKPLSRMHECFKPRHHGEEVIRTTDLMAQLNDRVYSKSAKNFEKFDNLMGGPNNQYNFIPGEVTKEELEKVMKLGWKNPKLDAKVARRLYHRMCFVVTQNLFSDSYYKKEDQWMGAPIWARNKNERADFQTYHGIRQIEKKCHEYVDQLYGRGLWAGNDPDNRPQDDYYAPIVFERKVRAYKTTNQYVYRGGKSLNINVNASFNVSNSTGIKASTSVGYEPTSFLGAIGDELKKVPFLGAIWKSTIGGYKVSRQIGRDESAGRTNGTTVSSGTFLVSQQATFDIALGAYERCMVARLHPAFWKEILADKNIFKGNFDPMEDIGSYGVMICTGRRIEKCLPIKEKYYYFTQHFTEGDMLDTADLHNHPWLLELRGYRDYINFTKVIGARPVDFTNSTKNWTKELTGKLLSDTAAFNYSASNQDNKLPEFEVINREEGINWPIDDLNKSYFEVLPTFPGLYTYMNETGESVKEWPNENTHPGRSFPSCQYDENAVE